MARGDGKAIRGRTKQPKPEPRNNGVRRMAIGGSTSSNFSGGDYGSPRGGWGSTPSSSPSSSSSSPASDNGFRDSSAVGSYGGGGGGNAGSAASRSSMGTSIGSGGNAGSYGGVSSSRAGTSAANVAAAASPTGLANSASAAMHAAMVADRVNYGTTTSSAAANAATRAATQAASASSPTGVRGTLSSFNPQPAPVAGYGRSPVYNSAMDAATVVPGSVSFNQVKERIPFATSPLGLGLIEQSKQPLTEEQAIALSKQLPKGSVLIGKRAAALQYPAPKNFQPSAYNSYPASIEGYSFDVAVPKSATTTTTRTVGQWSPSTASAASTSDFRGLPSPSQPSSGMAYSGAYQAAAASGPSAMQTDDLRMGPIVGFSPRAPVPAGTPGLYSPKEIVGRLTQEEINASTPATLTRNQYGTITPNQAMVSPPSDPWGDAVRSIFGPFDKAATPAPANTTVIGKSSTPYSPSSIDTPLTVTQRQVSPPSSTTQPTSAPKELGFWEGLSSSIFGTPQPTKPATVSSGTTTIAYNPAPSPYTRSASSPSPQSTSNSSYGLSFNASGRGSYSGAAPSSSGTGGGYPSPSGSPLQTSAAVAAALGGVDRFPNRDGGGERLTYAERLRRKRLEEQQAASDQVTSGTTAMRSGGRANGLARRGWTRGRVT